MAAKVDDDEILIKPQKLEVQVCLNFKGSCSNLFHSENFRLLIFPEDLTSTVFKTFLFAPSFKDVSTWIKIMRSRIALNIKSTFQPSSFFTPQLFFSNLLKIFPQESSSTFRFHLHHRTAH